MLAPDGGLSRLNVSVLTGVSGSVALSANVSGLPSLMVWLGIAASTGALFASLTVTVKLFTSLKLGTPSSVTRTVIVLVPGPFASLGVQLNTPLLGLMLAPAGAPGSRLYVNVFAGTSASVAETVKDSAAPSLLV